MQLPAKIGKYELEEFLGGGMSHVYRARDTVIGRTVAVKILTEAGCEDEEAKARFLAEARMAGNISHENVLSIYDFGEDDQHHPFMVMEFLRGEDLRHALKNGRTGDLRGKLKIALQVARALLYIHSQKIIHRDIKPENVHISQAGVVKLMDFGIAKTEGLSMTRAGYVLGTPYYMAPEQVMGQNITEQVDVYAFGVLLFELVTSVKPIEGDTVERIFYSILNEPLNLAPLRQAGAPESVCSLVARCTAKSPAERPPGFAPVVAELDRILADLDGPTVVLPPSHLHRPATAFPAARMDHPGDPGGCRHHRCRSLLRDPSPRREVFVSHHIHFAARHHIHFNRRHGAGSRRQIPLRRKERTGHPSRLLHRQDRSHQRRLRRILPGRQPPVATRFPSESAGPACSQCVDPGCPTLRQMGRQAPPHGARMGEGRPRHRRPRLPPGANDTADATKANINTNHIQPVTGFSAGASPFGALQMVGNVWELVDEFKTPGPHALEFGKQLTPPATPDEPWYTIRGASFSDPLPKDVIWDSITVPARWKNPNIGFRCAKDAQ